MILESFILLKAMELTSQSVLFTASHSKYKNKYGKIIFNLRVLAENGAAN